MENFISLENQAFGSILVEFLLLLIISSVLVWIFILLASKTKKLKDIAYKQRIKLSGLHSLIAHMVILTIYIAIFIALNGVDRFHWGSFPMDTSNTYYLMLPQILTYVSVIVAYLLINNKLRKEIKL